MIYFILIFLIYSGAVFSLYKHNDIHNKWRLEYFILISFLIILIGGLRYEVGSDWGSYLQMFNNSMTDDKSAEPGYLFLNQIFKVFNLPYAALLIFIFIVSYTLKVFVFGKYSSNIFIALMVYIPIQFIVYDINAIRQGLATGILLTSLPFIFNRKLIPFLIICFIATSIHTTSLVFVPFYWIALKKISDKNIIYLLILFIGIAFLSAYILDSLLPLFGIDFMLFEKFLSYKANDSYNKVLTFNLSTIYRVLVLVIFIIMHKRLEIKEEVYLLIRNGYFLSLAIYFTFFSVELIATRGSLYFRIFDTFIFTYIVTSFKDIYLKQLVLFFLLLYVCLQVVVSLSMDDNSLLPYHNLLFTW